MHSYSESIFINCPYDKDYNPILCSIVFTVQYLGFQPRLASERTDSSETRIEKIIDLIINSQYSIHDLSRIVCLKKGEIARMNMPFELGIDYGCKKTNISKFSDKQFLILESKRYQIQKALSDIAGCDPKAHNDDPIKAIECVRNWLSNIKGVTFDSHTKIWNHFNDFNSSLSDKLIALGFKQDETDKIQKSELVSNIQEWLILNRI